MSATAATAATSTIKRCFILDRSGSMANMIDDTIGGFNAFIDAQKSLGGTMSLYLFDNEFDVVYEDMPIEKVQNLTKKTFVPRGSTALHDAVGKVITNVGKQIMTGPVDINVIIMTDGHENASKKYTSDHIKDLIEIHTKLGWNFMYMGANQDSILEAGKMGINSDNTLDFDINTVQDAMRSVSHVLRQQSQGTPTTLRQFSSPHSHNTAA
jgi:hypothetical protein